MSTEDDVFLRLKKRPFDEVRALYADESKSEDFRASDEMKLAFFEDVGWTAEQFNEACTADMNKRAAEKIESIFAWVRGLEVTDTPVLVSTESKDGK